jgi:hypothetical protein
MENSELDVIYATLLQSSPVARYPDMADTVRSETAGHHEKLLAMAKRRCRAEKTMLRAALLAGHHCSSRLLKTADLLVPSRYLRQGAFPRS